MRNSVKESFSEFITVGRQTGYIKSMLQGASVRFGRFLVAFLAIWCLGCNSFDTLAIAMTSATMVPCSDSPSSNAERQQAQPTISAHASNQSSIEKGCGCDHCVGRDIVVMSAPPIELAHPEAFNLLRQFPAKVSREPSVPPPELRTKV